MDIFFQGEKDVSKMKTAFEFENLCKKKFIIGERLKTSQIKSYFSNLAKDKEKSFISYNKLRMTISGEKKKGANDFEQNEDFDLDEKNSIQLQNLIYKIESEEDE